METRGVTSMDRELDGFKDKKINVIQDLIESPEVLKGLYSSLEVEVSKRIDGQIQTTEQNIAKSRDLKNLVVVLEELRGSTRQKLDQSKQVEQQWQAIEQDMYKAIQPFSMPALQAKLAQLTRESEAASETMAVSFLDAGGSIDEFIKDYRRERKLYHLRKERLERWKEERVAKTSVSYHP
ncbi:hypothetical protein TRVA0_058S00276 [Trichomonascus vanleenenianus]|uniref:ESCRT-I subunit protein SRN2 n=1 Tax=Trichomonascus vanleenenianus TaxID=2268995 RepID=UPI003ECB8CEB